MPASLQPLRTIRAAYDFEAPTAVWLRNITLVAHADLKKGNGSVAYEFRQASEEGAIEVFNFVSIEAPDHAAAAITAFHDAIPSSLRSKLLSHHATFSTLSRLKVPVLHEQARALGISDASVLIVSEAPGRGCCFMFSPSREKWKLRGRQPARWNWVAAHIGQALKWRRIFSHEDLWSRVEAAWEPGGRLVHATCEAPEGDTGERLRAICLALDRACSNRGQEEGKRHYAMLDMWPAIVDGRWSIIEHFACDGRRYFVALKNRPDTWELTRLNERETSVAEKVADAYTDPEIVSQLSDGERRIALSTVKKTLERVREKLLLSSRTDLTLLENAVEVARIELDDDELCILHTPHVLDHCEHLTPRERDIVLQIVTRRHEQQMARRLGMSLSTFRNNLAAIRVKFKRNEGEVLTRGQLITRLLDPE